MEKKTILKLIVFSLVIFIFASCDTYPEYEQEYSPSYPICGNYFVMNYSPDAKANYEDAISDMYEIYLYSSSIEAEKYVWINTQVALASTSFRVKTEYNIETLSFDGVMLPHSPSSALPPDSAVKYITIDESIIIEKEWPIPDSISFKVSIYDGEKALDSVIYVQGHRSTGQEVPYWDNPSGN